MMTEKKISKKQEERINNAIENLKKMNEILAPYIPDTRIEGLPKGGEWKRSLDKVLTREDFDTGLRKIARPVPQVTSKKR